MIVVRCENTDIDQHHSSEVRGRLRESIRVEGGFQELSRLKEYVVLSLEWWEDGLRIYLHAEESHYFPSPYPIELFSFLDTTIPEGWALGLEVTDQGAALRRLSFSEWALDPGFFERLVDEDEEAMTVYERRRQDLRRSVVDRR